MLVVSLEILGIRDASKRCDRPVYLLFRKARAL